MPPEFIYTSYRLARHYPPDRTVLEDISISFYPGAKIGVIGPERRRQVQPAADHGRAGRRVHRRGPPDARLHGRLPRARSRGSTRPRTSRATSSTASREVQGLIDQYNAVMARWSEPDADYEAIGAEQAALEDRITPPTRGTWSATSTSRWTPCAARRTTPTSAPCPAARSAAWRSAGCCSGTPTCSCSTSRPTTSTPSRSSGWSGSSRSTRAPSSRSPTTATSSTTSRSGSWSWTAAEGSRSPATTRAGSSRSSTGCRASRRRPTPRQRTLARELEWVRLSPRARQAKGKARLGAYEQLLAEAQDDEGHRPGAGDRHPAGSAPGRHGHRGQGPAQGVRRPAADRGPDVLAAAGRHRRHHRRQRRGQDDAVPDARRPGAARRGQPSRSATPCS